MPRLSRRPMGRVLKPLLRMGLEVVDQGKETLPLTLRGSPDLIPIEYQLPVPSAQIKSAVLIAGLHAAGETTVIEPEATRDHTERMLRPFRRPADGDQARRACARSRSRAMPSLSGQDVQRAGRSELGRVPGRGRADRARLRGDHRRRARQSDAHRLLHDAAGRWAPTSPSSTSATRAASRSPTFACGTPG